MLELRYLYHYISSLAQDSELNFDIKDYALSIDRGTKPQRLKKFSQLHNSRLLEPLFSVVTKKEKLIKRPNDMECWELDSNFLEGENKDFKQLKTISNKHKNLVDLSKVSYESYEKNEMSKEVKKRLEELGYLNS